MGQLGQRDGQFDFHYGIYGGVAVDAQGTFYVTDSFNGKERRTIVR